MVGRKRTEAECALSSGTLTRPCEGCGEPLPNGRAHRRHCNARCRAIASRRRRGLKRRGTHAQPSDRAGAEPTHDDRGAALDAVYWLEAFEFQS
jgi:hypothetical protein